MLVCQNISPQQGRNYYLDDVSFENFKEISSSWYGRGATSLNLFGAVEPDDFQSLLSGFIDGKRFRKLPNQANYKQRGAIDCIFAAPKSVTLLALVNSDRDLLIAHDRAVDRVLDLIEERYSTTRIRTQDGRIVVNTKNLVIAKFPHSTSRELDPHLHTHCVILNMTKTDRDRWLSLKNDDIFLHQKFLGKIYQNELAFNVRQLGYSVEFNSHGQMEIAQCDRSIVEAASKRRLQIQARLDPDSSWRKEKLAWATTRKPKQNISAADLRRTWRLEFSLEPPTKSMAASIPSVVSQEIVDSSVEEAQKWHPIAFSLESVEENILELYPGGFSWSNIFDTVKEKVRRPSISKSPTVLTIETIANWQDWQRKWDRLNSQRRDKTLIIVAENNPHAVEGEIVPGKPWNANFHQLKSSKIVSFQHILVLHRENNSKIGLNLKECLRRLRRTFKSRINNSICDRSNYVSPSREQIFQESPEYYQDWYSNLKAEMGDNSDKAIALQLHQQHIPLPEIRKVLARSDRIHQLRQLHDDDRLYQQKAIDYIESIEFSLSPMPSVQKKFQNTLEKSQTEREI